MPAPEDAVREGVETDPGLVEALRQLAYAVRALQLYPPSSQVVSRAVRRAHKTLSPFVSGGRLSLAILPETIRIGGEDVGAGNSTLRSLAECLHQRGVAHLHLDASLARSSLERLAEMLSTDADTLNEQGGIGALCERQQLQGLAVDMLQLDKLYEDEEDVEVDPEAAVWEQILGGYRDDLDLSAIDWETLADDSEQLADFLSWLLDDESPPPDIAEMSRLQVVRTVCERVGAAAAELGSDRLEAVARVVGRFYDKLDKEVWIDVLGQPLEVANNATPSVDNRPPASDLDDTERKIRTVATELAAADLAQSIAETLSRDQAEDLLVYALTSREAASPRIFGLFHRLLEARDERELMERSIREKVGRQTTSEAGRKIFEELWPLLNDALHGEHMDAYVSTTYRAQMELLLSNAPLTSLWNIERIAPRMRELEPGYLMQRKAKVILGILSSETTDDDYVALVEVLERSLPELLVDGQYISTEEILGALATDLIPSSGRSDQKHTPEGLAAAKWRLHLVSEMVTIADVYDALRSTRPYRAEIPADRAMEIMHEEAEEKFNPDLFAGFARLVGYYPPGICVRLSNGETAIVYKTNPDALRRPGVLVVRGADGDKLAAPRHTDLADRNDCGDLSVASVLDAEEAGVDPFDYL